MLQPAARFMLSHKRKLRWDIIKRNVFIARGADNWRLKHLPALFETRVAKKQLNALANGD